VGIVWNFAKFCQKSSTAFFRTFAVTKSGTQHVPAGTGVAEAAGIGSGVEPGGLKLVSTVAVESALNVNEFVPKICETIGVIRLNGA
jgi:hypothetical protein